MTLNEPEPEWLLRAKFVTLSVWIHSTCCLLTVMVFMWSVAHMTPWLHCVDCTWLYAVARRGRLQ